MQRKRNIVVGLILLLGILGWWLTRPDDVDEPTTPAETTTPEARAPTRPIVDPSGFARLGPPEEVRVDPRAPTTGPVSATGVTVEPTPEVTYDGPLADPYPPDPDAPRYGVRPDDVKALVADRRDGIAQCREGWLADHPEMTEKFAVTLHFRPAPGRLGGGRIVQVDVINPGGDLWLRGDACGLELFADAWIEQGPLVGEMTVSVPLDFTDEG